MEKKRYFYRISIIQKTQSIFNWSKLLNFSLCFRQKFSFKIAAILFFLDCGVFMDLLACYLEVKLPEFVVICDAQFVCVCVAFGSNCC